MRSVHQPSPLADTPLTARPVTTTIYGTGALFVKKILEVSENQQFWSFCAMHAIPRGVGEPLGIVNERQRQKRFVLCVEPKARNRGRAGEKEVNQFKAIAKMVPLLRLATGPDRRELTAGRSKVARTDSCTKASGPRPEALDRPAGESRPAHNPAAYRICRLLR